MRDYRERRTVPQQLVSEQEIVSYAGIDLGWNLCDWQHVNKCQRQSVPEAKISDRDHSRIMSLFCLHTHIFGSRQLLVTSIE